jgi:hypothetical protein
MPEINPPAFSRDNESKEKNPTASSAPAPKAPSVREGVGIKWTAPEFDYYPKGGSWYYGSIAITLLLLAFAVWQKNFLFAFFIVVAEILVLSWGAKRPVPIIFKLDENGLTIGSTKFYSYADLKNFGISDIPPIDEKLTEIVIYLKRRLRPSLSILLPKDRSAEIEAAFEKKIPKVEIELTLLDALEKLLRF